MAIPTTQKFKLAYKYYRNMVQGRPYSVNLEITKKCNAKCDFCDYWKTKQENVILDYGPIVKKIDPIMVNSTCVTVARPQGTHLPCATLNIASSTLTPGGFADFGFAANGQYSLFDGCPNQYGCEFWAVGPSTGLQQSCRFVVNQNGQLLNATTGVGAPVAFTSQNFRWIECYANTTYALDDVGGFWINPQNTTVQRFTFDSGVNSSQFVIRGRFVYVSVVNDAIPVEQVRAYDLNNPTTGVIVYSYIVSLTNPVLLGVPQG